MKELLKNAIANTTGNQATYIWHGGEGTVGMSGVPDGATVSLMARLPWDRKANVDAWIAVGGDTSFTANGIGNFKMASGIELRFDVTGAGASTDVTAGIGGAEE